MEQGKEEGGRGAEMSEAWRWMDVEEGEMGVHCKDGMDEHVEGKCLV